MEEFFGRLNEFHKKYSRFLRMALLILAVAVMFSVLPYLLALMMPFVMGWIISLAAYPLVKMLKKRLKIPYKVGAVITVLLLLTVLTLLIAFIVDAVSAFITALALFMHSLNSFSGTLSATIPAPERTKMRPFFLNARRIAMQVSRLPRKSI